MVEFGRVYIDASVILRRVLNQPGALRHVEWETAFASELIAVELYRTVNNLRITGEASFESQALLREAVQASVAALDLVPLDHIVLNHAGGPFATPIRTLDAIHLATALLWADHFDGSLTLLTHDRQLAVAARASGLAVHPWPLKPVSRL